MEKERGITIIGLVNAGKQAAIELAKDNDLCVLHSVVDSQFTDLKNPEPLLITRPPELEEPWIDPNEPVINYKKHEQTCVKNRKKRKKKRCR